MNLRLFLLGALLSVFSLNCSWEPIGFMDPRNKLIKMPNVQTLESRLRECPLFDEDFIKKSGLVEELVKRKELHPTGMTIVVRITEYYRELDRKTEFQTHAVFFSTMQLAKATCFELLFAPEVLEEFKKLHYYEPEEK